MRSTFEKIGTPPRTKILAFTLFVSTLVFSFIPLSVHAEATPNTDPANQTGTVVDSPGAPTATSSTNDDAIVWVWTAPASGLTPDAPTDPSQITTPPSEQPTDIIQFGYELSNAGGVVTSGTVDSSVLTVTTPVTQDDTYTFKVWSINRVAATSAPAVGTITINTSSAPPVGPVTPITPPIDGSIIPAPLDSTTVDKPAPSSQTPTPVPLNKPTNVVPQSSNVSSDPSVLSATDTTQNIPKSAETAAAVKSSTQGWVIVGIPWYIWLLILAAVFAAGRWVWSMVGHRI